MIKSKPKVLVLTNLYPKSDLDYKGIFVKKNYNGLKKSFDTSIVFCKSSSNKFNRLFFYFIFFFKSTVALFRGHDLIYIHFPTRSALALVFFSNKKGKLAINFHGSDLNLKNYLNKFFFFLIRKKLNLSNLIISPSDYYKKKINKLFPKQKIIVSPSSGVKDSFYSTPVNKNKSSNIIYISTISEEKGIFDLIEAFLDLNKDLDHIKLSIYGHGKKEPLFKLKKIIKNHNNIKFYGPLIHNELPAVLNRHKFLVFPSRAESLGLIGLEALACGTPVVGSNLPAIQTYLKHDYNGLLFECANSSDLKAKMLKLLQDNKKYQKLCNNTRQSVSSFKQSIVINNLNVNLLKLLDDE